MIMQQKLDNVLLGTILGIIAPFIALYGIFVFGFPHETFKSFFDIIWYQELFTRIVSISVIANLALFFIFIWTNKLRSAKGVLGATIGYAIVIFAIKLFF